MRFTLKSTSVTCGLLKQLNLNKSANMAFRKYISVEKAMKLVYNDDSDDELIPELESCDNESHITMIWRCSYIRHSTRPYISPNYHPTPQL